MEKINLYSVTIAILTSQADAWEEVLKENYGEPVEGKEKSHGKKFTIKKFGVESEKTASIYVTLWKKEKFSRMTLLVDAKRNQTKSIEYVQNYLPSCQNCPSTCDFTKSKEKCMKNLLKARKRSCSSDPIIQTSKVKDIVCKDCFSKFASTVELNKHRWHSHEINFHPCHQCDYKAKNNEELKVHIEVKHEDEKSKHMKAMHGVYTTDISCLPLPTLSTCVACTLIFPTKIDLNMHMLNSHADEKVNCTYCDFEVIDEQKLQEHMKIVHEEEVIQIIDTTLPVENPGNTSEISKQIDTIADDNKKLRDEKAEIERKYKEVMDKNNELRKTLEKMKKDKVKLEKDFESKSSE